MNRPMLAVMSVSFFLLQGCSSLASLHIQNAPGSADVSSNHSVSVIPITSETLANPARGAAAEIPVELLEHTPGAYRIGAGDALFITVWDHPELTVPGGSQTDLSANSRVVSDQGTIFYPFIGKVRVAGLSPDQVRQTLVDQLSRLIDQPQIDVTVLKHESQKVTMTGAFARPGYLPLTARPLSLLEAVTTAGIDEGKADPSKLLLIRDGTTYTLDYDRLINDLTAVDEVYLRANDRLHLQSIGQGKIYVAGEVAAPHAISYTGNPMMLSAALEALGDSVSNTGSRDLYVIRDAKNGAGGKIAFQLHAKQPNAYMLADRFQLQPGDVVYVGSPRIDDWTSVLSGLFPGTVGATQQTEQVSHLD